ncbi:fungal-specific transcription factor domain-containing protein [Fusarium acuminatum]|uniref:Fungal-specific transcription factor domain-containing protein n=1 Tax=Fusarium acuminatum TaxID=5515 RepID=A0ABZ2WNX3_9HYPO
MQQSSALNEKRTDNDQSVAERLKKLEGLIATVAQGTSPKEPISLLSISDSTGPVENSIRQSSASIEASASAASEDVSEAQQDDGGARFASHIDSNHWYSILENIKAIRDELHVASPSSHTTAPSSLPPNTDLQASENLDFDLESAAGLNLDYVISKLPPRQYESFWESPLETPVIWIALLFSILSLSASVYEASGRVPNSQEAMPSGKDLSKRTQECLLLGNYTTSKEYGVEALLLHLVASWLRAKASDTNLWFLMGKVVQLAICKGFHRDSTKVPGLGISPFEGEMRRRVWLSLYQFEALMSFQLGLPSMVPTDCCDTALPSNLNQTDFYPEIPELPPSRPLSEGTPILYSIVKSSIMDRFKKVVKHTRSLVPPPYEETVSLDAEVRSAYESIPDIFKYKSLTSFIIEDPSIIMGRTTLELLHLKSIIVLHRQYLTHRNDLRFQFSRDSCLAAAERLLERQTEMHRVTQPGGQFHDMKWMITSLTMSDFTLAAMIICLDLTVTMRQGTVTFQNPKDVEDLHRYLEIIKSAHKIWRSLLESSEARIVSHALDSTIQRVGEYLSSRSVSASSETWQSSSKDADTPSYVTIDSADFTSDVDLMDYVDWTLIDNQFQDPNTQEFDLDYWLMDTAGPLEFMDDQ